MKKVWKWIIGIVLGLALLAVLAGVGFMVFGRFHTARGMAKFSPGYTEVAPGTEPFGGFGSHMRGPGMMPYGGFEHMRGFGMMGYGMNPLGGIIGGLFSLVFLALVVLGIIWLVNRLRKPQPVAVPASMPVAVPAAVMDPCKKCGKPLQDDWNVCPHCGKKV